HATLRVLLASPTRRSSDLAMFNAGQTCVSVERVYVLAPVYEQFVAAVVRAVEKLEVGAGEGRHFGALIDESQLAVTERHVADAVDRKSTRLNSSQVKISYA